ncbi:MAG: hypothetical protein HOP02_01640 [Methylococcaceae bacterium]|nr:hypothetical protein [Methylococcaceae bacterium]
MLKSSSWLIFTPFFVPIAFITFIVLFSIAYTGFPLSNNTYALCAFWLTIIGFLVGVVALFLAQSISVWWRLLIGLLYVPATLFSMIAAGF